MGLPASDNRQHSKTCECHERPSITSRRCLKERTSEYSGKAYKEQWSSTNTHRRKPGERPSVEKEVPSKMVYVAMDAETSQAGSLHSSVGSRKRVVFMKIPSQPKLCLLQTCHGIHKRLPWQQLQILKPLCCFQTAALRFSRCVALHVHHASAINLLYCFAIKRGHCNTGVAHIHRMILTPEAD